VEYDHLIKTRKVEEDENIKIEDIANANSRFPCLCYVEPNVRTLQNGDFVQFLRRGYYKVDQIHPGPGGDNVYEFIFTPDGKAKGLASIKTETDKKGDIKKQNLEEKVKNKNEKIGRAPGAEGEAPAVAGEEAKESKKDRKKREKAEAAEKGVTEDGPKQEGPKQDGDKKEGKKNKGKEGKKAPEGEKPAETNTETKEQVKNAVKEEPKVEANVEVKVDVAADKPKEEAPFKSSD
jgi:hypothetical protein